MTEQSPALKLEARANRAFARITKAREELRILAGIVERSDLPRPVIGRLRGALWAEDQLFEAEELGLMAQRQAAQISRGKQWVTSGDG